MIQAALRIARNATGRRNVLRFHGHYHGWFDNVQIRSDGDRVVPGSLGQIPEALDPMLTVEWNDPEAFTAALREHGDTIAGFRVALGGAAERFGVTPDLAVYGKAMAAGWPCAALVGRGELFSDV